MKIKLLACLLVLLFGLPLMAAPPKGISAQDGALTVDNSVFIDANKILMFVTNHGNFGRDLGGRFGYDYGTFFPFTSVPAIDDGSNVTSPYYAGGIWVGGRDSATGDTLVTVAIYSDEYVPGPALGGTFQADRAEFHVYKLFQDSLTSNPNADYTNWPWDQGASRHYIYTVDTTVLPWDSTLVDSVPGIIGDQFCWSACNDFNPAQHNNSSGSTAPLGIEVKTSTFAFSREDPLGNCLFIRFQIYNRGDKVLENCLFSIWSDPDLGGSGDDLVGVDTLTNLAYCYNATNSDQKYGSTPPAIGIDFFQGPLEYTGLETDTAKMWGKLWPGYKNMGMYSFNKYVNGTDPNDWRESYRFMAGLDAKNGGAPFVNPTTGQVTRYVMTGDPVTETGWRDNTPADRRMQETTGPITFRPGDSIEIVCAMVIGRGGDRLSSISVMRYYDRFAQDAYDKDFVLAQPPAPPVVSVAQLENEVVLNWTDTSEVDHGDYPFEGYTVYQGPGSSGPWTRIANFDVVNGVAQILDEVLDPATTALEQRLVKLGTDNGIMRYFTVTQDYLTGGPLRNLTTYYFRVEAYSFDNIATPKTLTSANLDPIELIPRAPVANETYSMVVGEFDSVVHVSGVSDGIITAEVIDPSILTGHTYRVTFEENNEAGLHAGNALGVAWFLIDSTSGDTLLRDMTNLSGDNNYPIKDGFMCRVSGPPLLGLAYQYVAPATPNISPVAAVDDTAYTGDRWFTGDPVNGGELMFGGIFMEPNFWGSTSLGPTDYPTIEVRWRPMQSYTDLNGDGHYTIGEPYVVDDTTLTQRAFMYQGFAGGLYQGFNKVPFSAWDVSDPANPRQVNVVVRDRDANGQWDENWLADTIANPADTILPRRGDLQYNYTWILNTTYDPTGTMYGDGTGGSVDFWSYDDGNGLWDAAWMMWLYPRTRPELGAEGILRLVPPAVITGNDSYSFVPAAPTAVVPSEQALAAIKAVPNPFYLFGPYDPAVGNYQIKFHHLPKVCSISIYNLAGDFITRIDKNDDTPMAEWNLQSDNRIPVSSGIYIYVVDAPGFGQKIGKLAVFYEDEVLTIY